MTEQPPTVFPFKVSLETTGKYVQPQITVYGNDFNEVRLTAISQLLATIKDLKASGLSVAPLEVKDSDK